MTSRTHRLNPHSARIGARLVTRLMLACVLAGWAGTGRAAEQPAAALAVAQSLFYNGQYAEAAKATESLVGAEADLAAHELRTAALLFQLRRAIGEPEDKEKAFKACQRCPELYADFMSQLKAGQKDARAVLAARPDDADALFFLGKLDLNYVWLVLGTLGRRTGWEEYWEARHSLDAALKLQPTHLRARVARAWIDYIVDTRMPWGTGWVLGGGNKKRAMRVMHEAAVGSGDFYDSAEALFGLWDMQVRERRFTEALDSARRLSVLFPNNPEVARFVATRSK
jgi:tetratricopeptide (TPR) repeat protein